MKVRKLKNHTWEFDATKKCFRFIVWEKDGKKDPSVPPLAIPIDLKRGDSMLRFIVSCITAARINDAKEFKSKIRNLREIIKGLRKQLRESKKISRERVKALKDQLKESKKKKNV